MSPRLQLYSQRTFLLIAALLASSLTIRAADAVDGNLLIVAKAEVEIYHNGRKVVLRDKSEDVGHYRAKVPERSLKAGDVFVLNLRSPYVYRVISAPINLPKQGAQIPIKKEHWRFLGEKMDPRKITSKEIKAAQTMLALGSPDPVGETEREKLGMLNTAQGSDWVKTADKLNGWYCIGFVITPEMLKALVPVPVK